MPPGHASTQSSLAFRGSNLKKHAGCYILKNIEFEVLGQKCEDPVGTFLILSVERAWIYIDGVKIK